MKTNDTRYHIIQQTSLLGPLFTKNAYNFLDLFRRGNGLSKDQGHNSAGLIARALKEKGQNERNEIQMQQLLTDQLRTNPCPEKQRIISLQLFFNFFKF